MNVDQFFNQHLVCADLVSDQLALSHISDGR